MRRLHPYATDEEIYPLVRTELAATLPVLFEVEGRKLDRPHVIDPERAPLSRRRLIILMPDVHLSPDTAHEQPVVISDVVFRDMDIFVAEVDELCPVLVVVG